MPMHPDRDIVVANLSVRPSVRHTLVLCRNEFTYRQTLSTIWYGHESSFLSATAVTKFQGELSGGIKYTRGWRNF